MKAAPSVGTEDQLFEWRKQSVDPDEKNLNSEFSEALKKERFSLDKFGSIAVINIPYHAH